MTWQSEASGRKNESYEALPAPFGQTSFRRAARRFDRRERGRFHAGLGDNAFC
jgi:hypothetical protein